MIRDARQSWGVVQIKKLPPHWKHSSFYNGKLYSPRKDMSLGENLTNIK